MCGVTTAGGVRCQGKFTELPKRTIGDDLVEAGHDGIEANYRGFCARHAASGRLTCWGDVLLWELVR